MVLINILQLSIAKLWEYSDPNPKHVACAIFDFKTFVEMEENHCYYIATVIIMPYSEYNSNILTWVLLYNFWQVYSDWKQKGRNVFYIKFNLKLRVI